MTMTVKFYSASSQVTELSSLSSVLKSTTIPFEKDGIKVQEAELDDVDYMVKHLSKGPSSEFKDIIEVYRKVFHHSSILICKNANNRVVGSQCLIYKNEDISIEIEKDLELYLAKNGITQVYNNIYYGSFASIDKEYFDNNGYEKDFAIRLWKSLLFVISQKVVSSESSVLLSHIEKDSFSVVCKRLGMPWIQIGEEVLCENQKVIPAMIDSIKLSQWISDASERHKIWIGS